VALEVPGEMRLVVEADVSGHPTHRQAIEELPASGLDPAPDEVTVGRDPEPAGERPDEVHRWDVEDPAGLGQRDALEEPRVQEVPEVHGDRAPGVATGTSDERGVEDVRFVDGRADQVRRGSPSRRRARACGTRQRRVGRRARRGEAGA
jgi:hypothetical protein